MVLDFLAWNFICICVNEKARALTAELHTILPHNPNIFIWVETFHRKISDVSWGLTLGKFFLMERTAFMGLISAMITFLALYDAALYYQCLAGCYMGGTLSLWSNQADDSDEWETDPDERGPSSKGNRGRMTTKKRGKRRHSRDSSNSSTSQDAPPRKRRRKKLHTAEYIYERLFLGGENADVTISALGRKWNLHKVYLKQSLFFAGMFSGDWSESNQQ
uniref:BTB domain-containing protein n=1 Tax=Plectus sambesii TaxID=2011161 RepID=A0A914X2T6_9BILA